MIDNRDRCEVCQIQIHPEAFHTGHERWCEDCFDRGLAKDMDQHFIETMRTETDEGTES